MFTFFPNLVPLFHCGRMLLIEMSVGKTTAEAGLGSRECEGRWWWLMVENMDPSLLATLKIWSPSLPAPPHYPADSCVVWSPWRPCNINSTMHVLQLQLQLPVHLLQCMHLVQSHRYIQSKNRQGRCEMFYWTTGVLEL